MNATLSPAPGPKLRERTPTAPPWPAPAKEAENPPRTEVAPALTTPAGVDAPTGPTSAGAKRRRPLLLALGAAAALGGLWFGGRAFLHSRNVESTDDAFIEGHVIPLSAKVSAHVVAVHFDDNTEVRRGDRLLELDARDFEASLAAAQANLLAARGRLAQAEAQGSVARATAAQARADITNAEATAENARADLRRSEDLGRQRVIDRRELDNAVARDRGGAAGLESARQKAAAAQAQIGLAEAGRQAALAEVTQGEAGVRQAELTLSYCRIDAPETGRVTRKNVEPGGYVQPGQTLLALVEPDVWVVANFKETQLTRMRPDQPVEVRVDAFPERPLRGHVDSIQSGTGARFSLLPAENATGNYVKVVQRVPVKVLLDEPLDIKRRLAPGMSVEPEVRVK